MANKRWIQTEIFVGHKGKILDIIYRYGSMAKIIESLMPKQITGFIDLNYYKLNNEKGFSIENGLKKILILF